MKNKIEFEFELRKYQREAMRGLESKRFSVIVGHRRFGKTELMVLRLIIAAVSTTIKHPAPLYGYFSPFLNQSKAVAWQRLKHYAMPFILSGQARTDETELAVKFWNGSVIKLFGADWPDRARGLGFNGVVLDEYANMKPEVWTTVLRPALSDRNGWAAFIGTPAGRNQFYLLYQAALKDEDWFTATYSADKTGVIPDKELKALRESMPESAYRQEYLCNFDADNDNTFILSEELEGATSRPKPLMNPSPLVMGLDVARFGDDRTVLVMRRGRVLEGYHVWNKMDLMYTSSHVSELIARYRPQALFVDSVGLGGGVEDRLKELGHKVIGIHAGGAAIDTGIYGNRKAEMWGKMREWLATAIIPDDEAIKNDLLAPVYEYDAYGKMRIESKKALKQRGVASTDIADALALTFAQTVASVDAQSGYGAGRPQFCIM